MPNRNRYGEQFTVDDDLHQALSLTGTRTMLCVVSLLPNDDAQRQIAYKIPDTLAFALAQYIFALEPPPNPNRGDPRAAAGKLVFERQGCGSCHTPLAGHAIYFVEDRRPPEVQFCYEWLFDPRKSCWRFSASRGTWIACAR